MVASRQCVDRSLIFGLSLRSWANFGAEISNIVYTKYILKSYKGEEIDEKFTKSVSRLTKRITVLKSDYENNEMDDAEFKEKMTKIEKEVAKIDNQLGLKVWVDKNLMTI